MSSMQPEGEAMRRAVRFVSDALREDPERPLGSLVDEAALRFDLDPRQTEYLLDFQRRAREGRTSD